jgi:hypothetical protein
MGRGNGITSPEAVETIKELVSKHGQAGTTEQDMASEFAKWFEAQHGKRPGMEKPSWQVLEELRRAQYECARLEAIYRAQEIYDERRTSALYAWQARSNAHEITGVKRPS